MNRQEFLGLAGMSAGALVLGGCGLSSVGDSGDLPRISPASSSGRVREYNFRAAPFEFETGGRAFRTWGYDDSVPGPGIRATEGDTLRVRVENRLPEETIIHWHGLPVPSAMDGVPGVSQAPIRKGEKFTYEFVVPTAGTYTYHSTSVSSSTAASTGL